MDENADAERASLLAALRALAAAHDHETVATMEAHLCLDDHGVPLIEAGDVVLFGHDGQVDMIWKVHGVPPEVLYVPLRSALSAADPMTLTTPFNLPVAEYRRVSEHTYQRSGLGL